MLSKRSTKYLTAILKMVLTYLFFCLFPIFLFWAFKWTVVMDEIWCFIALFCHITSAKWKMFLFGPTFFSVFSFLSFFHSLEMQLVLRFITQLKNCIFATLIIVNRKVTFLLHLVALTYVAFVAPFWRFYHKLINHI